MYVEDMDLEEAENQLDYVEGELETARGLEARQLRWDKEDLLERIEQLDREEAWQ